MIHNHNPPVTPSGGYDREYETRGFKMKAAYDKTHMLHLEPSEETPTPDARTAFADGFRSGFVMAVFVIGLAAILAFVLYIGCK